MRFVCYLTEGKITLTESQCRDMLQKECSQWLKERKTAFPIYRGFGSVLLDPEDSFLLKTPRSDRKPLSKFVTRHKIADNIFKKEFGWKGRSEGVLCSSSIGFFDDDTFGEPYEIFPFDGYKYIYNPNLDDFWYANSKIKDYKSVAPRTFEDLLSDENTGFNKAVKAFEEWLKESYTDEPLSKHKSNNNGFEIMLNCRKYIAVHNDEVMNLEL